MKERIKNILKWFFIILGVLYLIQLLFISGILAVLTGISKLDITPQSFTIKRNTLKPIILYVEDYKETNGEYPKELPLKEKVKTSTYDYAISEDGNCYTIKEKTKNNVIKEYKRCSSKTDTSNINSESYKEYTE